MTENEIDKSHPKGSIQLVDVVKIAKYEVDLFEGRDPEAEIVIFPPHQEGTIELVDVGKIAASLINTFQDDLKHEPTLPTGLKRLFELRRPKNSKDKSWIPWDELSGPLLRRVEMADKCQKRMLDKFMYDKNTGKSAFSPVSIQHMFASELRMQTNSQDSIDQGVEYDLDDVYVCAEAALLEITSASGEVTIDNAELIQKYKSFLKITGQALSEPLKI